MIALTLYEVATRMNVAYRTAWSMCQDGTMPGAFRIGKRGWRVWEHALDTLGSTRESSSPAGAAEERSATQCPSASVATSTMSTSPTRRGQASQELDTLLERLTGKPPRNTTTA